MSEMMKYFTVSTKNGGRYYSNKLWSYPSVTTIIGEFSDKSWLKRWEERVGKEKTLLVSRNSTQRGTFMHELVEKYMYLSYNEKNNDNIIVKTVLEVLKDPKFTRFDTPNKENGKNLFIKLLKNGLLKVDKLILQEEVLYSHRGRGYAGRVDEISIKDGKLKIIDYKSSTHPKREKYIDNYKMQAAAYCVAYYDLYEKLPDGYEIIISNEKSNPQRFYGDRNDIKKYFKMFLNLVNNYHKKYDI